MSDKDITEAVVRAYEKIELFGDGPKAHELSNVIKEHAVLGTAAGLIPIPGADIAALAANTWTMYVRINKVVGVKFSDNALKSIASGVIANLATLIPGIGLAVAVGSLLKFIPGIGTIGGMALEAAANGAVMYVAGRVYLKALEVLIHSDKPLTEENIKTATRQTSKDKTFVKDAYAEAKKVVKKK